MTTETPLRQREFGPEMQPTAAEVATIEAAGLTDQSWHNNICISFDTPVIQDETTAAHIFILWLDAIEPDDREMQGSRISVIRYDDEYNSLDEAPVYEGDSLADALAAIPDPINTANWDQ